MGLYETLGVAKDATAEAIKAAYRKLAQQHHPDKGGDKDRFQQVQGAYDVLSDPEKRAEYDATGQVGQRGPTVREQAMEVISTVLDEMIENYDPVHDNIIEKAISTVRQGLKSLEKNAAEMTARRDKVLAAMKRTSAKKGRDDQLAQVLAYIERQFSRPLEQIAANKAKCEEALRILCDHEYTPDARPAQSKRQQGLRDPFAGLFGGAQFNSF